MAESTRRAGAGSRLSGVLEKTTPHNPPVEPDDYDVPVAEAPDAEAGSSKGRGAVAARKAKGVDAKAARRIKPRTIHLPDDLFERILVQSHRRGRTISEYVTGILERQVPDYRTLRVDVPAEVDREG